MQPILKKPKLDIDDIVDPIHRAKDLSTEEFTKLARLWAGREISQIPLPMALKDLLQAMSQDKTCFDVKVLKQELKVLKGRLKLLPDDLQAGTSQLLSDIKAVLGLLRGQSGATELSAKVQALITTTKSGVWSLWNDKFLFLNGHSDEANSHSKILQAFFYAHSSPRADLEMDDRLAKVISDADFKIILQHTDPTILEKITHFDLLIYSRLSVQSLIALSIKCPNLSPSCFRSLKSPSYVDHELVIGAETISINKALLAHLIPYFGTMWCSQMKEGHTESRQTALFEVDYEALVDCMNILVGDYDIADEKEFDRAFAIVHQAIRYDLDKIALPALQRAITIVDSSEKESREKYKLISDMYKMLEPHFSDPKFAQLRTLLQIAYGATCFVEIGKAAEKFCTDEKEKASSPWELFLRTCQQVFTPELEKAKHASAMPKAIIKELPFGPYNKMLYHAIGNHLFPIELAEALELGLQFIESSDLLIALGELHNRSWSDRDRDLEKATSLFDQACKLNPKHSIAYILYGECLLQKKDFDGARAFFGNIAEAKENSIVADIIAFGACLHYTGHLSIPLDKGQADSLFLSAYNNNSDSFMIHAYKALASMGNQVFECSQALREAPRCVRQILKDLFSHLPDDIKPELDEMYARTLDSDAF
jgi:tetratricopeptide (TPR) repeat protein